MKNKYMHMKCATCEYWDVEGQLGICGESRSPLYERPTKSSDSCERYKECAAIYEQKKEALYAACPEALIVEKRPTGHSPDNHYIYLGGCFWQLNKKIREQL